MHFGVISVHAKFLADIYPIKLKVHYNTQLHKTLCKNSKSQEYGEDVSQFSTNVKKISIKSN